MLTKNQKKELVRDLSEKIKNSKSVIFADFRGLKVKNLQEIKKELRQSGAEFKVVKKKIIDIALENAKVEMKTKEMDGQIAVSISSQDEIAPAKIIEKFSRKNENIKIVGGILGIRKMSADEAKSLAKLPSRKELLAMVAGTINAPASGFVNVLAGNLRGLVQVLKAVSEKK